MKIRRQSQKKRNTITWPLVRLSSNPAWELPPKGQSGQMAGVGWLREDVRR